MRPTLQGRIERCTQSVCPVRPSVCPVPTIFSKLGSGRNFTCGGCTTLDMCNLANKFNVRRSKVKVTWNEKNVKSFFVHILMKRGSIYIKPIKCCTAFVSLSRACLLFAQKSKCRRNFQFIGHLIQDTSN